MLCFGWLAGWLAGEIFWPAGWLAGWLAGEIYWLAGWLAGKASESNHHASDSNIFPAQINGKSMEINGNQWEPMEINGNLRKSMGTYGNQ